MWDLGLIKCDSCRTYRKIFVFQGCQNLSIWRVSCCQSSTASDSRREDMHAYISTRILFSARVLVEPRRHRCSEKWNQENLQSCWRGKSRWDISWKFYSSRIFLWIFDCRIDISTTCRITFECYSGNFCLRLQIFLPAFTDIFDCVWRVFWLAILVFLPSNCMYFCLQKQAILHAGRGQLCMSSACKITCKTPVVFR